MIYFDNNATTSLDPKVADAMLRCYACGPMNAASQHAIGRDARRQLDQAISLIGRLLGADVDSPGGDQLVLTSGGSESNNMALRGIGDPMAPLVVSAIEHPSVLAVASHLQQCGREVRIIRVDQSGIVDLESAAEAISRPPLPSLVSVMAANNETGVIQPIREIAELCNRLKVACHSDATQTVGKLPFDFASSGLSAVTFTAHKFHGPTGIGGLLVRAGVALRSWIVGGEQQLGKRAGTEPVPLVVGMGEALNLASSDFDQIPMKMRRMRDQIEHNLSQSCTGIIFHGADSERLPGTSCFSLPGIDRQAMLMALDMAGIACSSGSACASGSSRPSHVLSAMGLPTSLIDSAIRIGISKFSTPLEISSASEVISRQEKRLRDLSAVEKQPR